MKNAKEFDTEKFDAEKFENLRNKIRKICDEFGDDSIPMILAVIYGKRFAPYASHALAKFLEKNLV